MSVAVDSATSTHAPPAPRVIVFNATVAAVLGAALMVLVHEIVHLVTGLGLGLPGTLYSYGVEMEGTAVQNAVVALSAPLFSLATGLLLAFWTPLRRRGGFGHLLWLFFAFASLMEGVGYLIITPFGAGDTAYAADQLGWGVAPRLVLCVVGIGLQFLVGLMFAVHVGRLAGRQKAHRLALTIWPWLVGTLVNLALTFLNLSTGAMELTPGQTVAVAAAGSAVLVFGPMSMIFTRVMDRQQPERFRLPSVPVLGIVGILAMVALNQLLNLGIQVG